MPKRATLASPNDEVVVLVTTPSEDEAVKIGRSLVEARLAACANIVPGIRSVYRWEGKVADERECLMLIKTRSALFGVLEAAVKAMHSYTVPEIIAVPIMKGFRPYLKWLQSETRNPLKSRIVPKTI